MSNSTPRFLCDENIPRDLGSIAQGEGFDVVFLVDIAIGEADTDILARAHRDRRVILTEDTDFGRLIFSTGNLSFGVVLIRIAPWKIDLRKARLRMLLRRDAYRLVGSFTALSETTIRIRPLTRGA